MSELTNDQIGTFGEQIIENWCNYLRVTFNKSRDKDDKGWDYFLQFPDKIFKDGKFKYLNMPNECLVQVKATEDLSKSIKISLSNYKYLLDTPLPAFFFRVQVNKNGEPVKASLTELDEFLAKKIINKINSEQDEPLHKLEMTLYKKNSIILDDCTPLVFKGILDNKISNLDKYIEQKRQLKDKLGYNSFSIKFEIEKEKLADESFLKKLQDFDLGILPQLDLRDIKKSVTWFGREKEGLLPLDEISHIKILSKENEKNVNVEFATGDSRVKTLLYLKFHQPTIFRNVIPDKHRKYRFSDSYLDITHKREDNNTSITVNFPENQVEFELASLHNVIDYYYFLSQIKNAETFTISVIDGDKRFTINKCRFDEFPSKESTKIFKSLYFLRSIFDKINIPQSEKINLNNVYQNSERINLIGEIIEKGDNLIYQYTLESEFSDSSNESVIALIPIWVNLGSLFIWIIFSVKGKAKKVEDGAELDIQLYDQKVFIEDSGFQRSGTIGKDYIYSINNKYEELSDKYDDPFTVIKTETGFGSG